VFVSRNLLRNRTLKSLFFNNQVPQHRGEVSDDLESAARERHGAHAVATHVADSDQSSREPLVASSMTAEMRENPRIMFALSYTVLCEALLHNHTVLASLQVIFFVALVMGDGGLIALPERFQERK